MKERIREELLRSGAIAVGFAKAGEVEPSAALDFEKWIGEGYHAGMDYLERHVPLRKDTNNVLEGAKTVISLAYSYVPPELRAEKLPMIATYAYGEDYHKVIRKRLKPIIREFKESLGGEWRICIDSAPMEERYWAVKAGIGVRGLNGAVIVENCGSLCFLTEILTTIEFESDKESEGYCEGCGRCMDECPGKALRGDGTIDSSCCLSYLTIEKKDDFTEREKSFLKSLPVSSLFGCDICLRVCPHNVNVRPTEIEEFFMKEETSILDGQKLEEMSSDDFKIQFGNTPLARCGLSNLKRNLHL